MTKKDEIIEAQVKGFMPTVATLAWDAFEEQGLTRKVKSYHAWENGIAAAIHNMEKYLDNMLPVIMQIVDALQAKPVAENGGARWLNPKTK